MFLFCVVIDCPDSAIISMEDGCNGAVRKVEMVFEVNHNIFECSEFVVEDAAGDEGGW